MGRGGERQVGVYSGRDPYDALRGSRVPAFVRSHPRMRQAVIQARKRSPIDLSGVLGVEAFMMAKTLGAYLTATSRYASETGGSEEVRLLAEQLGADETIARMDGGGWGYEFDVQTRWAFYPSGSPNLIATVFVGRGFGSAAAVARDAQHLERMSAAADFLQERMLTCAPTPRFMYTLTSDRLIHNANFLGAGLVAMAGALASDTGRVSTGLQCAQTSMHAQRDDGSWPYGEGASLGWADNFHTAYNLDGLLQVWLASGDEAVHDALRRGVEHWVHDFFGPEGEPKYYPTRPYPYDIHSAGTAVDVAARLASWGFDTGDVARRVASWTKKHLVEGQSGVTYYQKHRSWTDKRHFVRWGDAHWALGEASLGLLNAGRRDPLEEAVARAAGVVRYER